MQDEFRAPNSFFHQCRVWGLVAQLREGRDCLRLGSGTVSTGCRGPGRLAGLRAFALRAMLEVYVR